MDTTSPVEVDQTVVMVKPLGPYEEGQAVIVRISPGRMPLEGGGSHPINHYLLLWPSGSSNWHMRHHFAPVQAQP